MPHEVLLQVECSASLAQMRLALEKGAQLRSFDVKGSNSFIFRIARGVTEIDPRKSASVMGSHEESANQHRRRNGRIRGLIRLEVGKSV
jgi:hypothetical protein